MSLALPVRVENCLLPEVGARADAADALAFSFLFFFRGRFVLTGFSTFGFYFGNSSFAVSGR